MSSQEQFLGFGRNNLLAHLVCSWLGETTGPNAIAPPAEPSFFTRRCLAVARRAAAKQAAPLLAAPTHEGGWINPAVLVQRISEYFWLKIEPDKADFIQSLLRLAPDNRVRVLQAAAALKNEIGEVIRYVLGGGKMANIRTPEFWVAAFRAREPKGTSEVLFKFFPRFAPDAAEAAKYGLDMQPVLSFATDRYSSISKGLPDFLPLVGMPSESRHASCDVRANIIQKAIGQVAQVFGLTTFAFYPTVLLHENKNSWFAGTGTYDWLHNRESLLALHAKRILQNIDSIGSYWHRDFEWLFDPDLSIARMDAMFCVLVCRPRTMTWPGLLSMH